MAVYAVIGLGQLGRQAALTLMEKGADVLVIDRDGRKVEQIKDEVTQAVRADCTDEEAMRSLGVGDAATAIIALGDDDFEASVLTTAVLKSLGVGRIVARAATPLQGKVLELVGATRVVFPETQFAIQLVRSLVAQNVLESIPLATGHSLVELTPREEFVGRTLKELDLRARFGVNIIAIRRRVRVVGDDGEVRLRDSINDLPHPSDVLDADDVLVVVGSDERIEELARAS